VTGTSAGIEGATVPRLSPLFRMQWEQAQGAFVLLYPEGMVKLNGPAGEILKRVDGVRDVDAIVAELNAAFDADVRADVLEFLAGARERGWVR
jgi:pyrroloquinoline quinone biosynthesis protein D